MTPPESGPPRPDEPQSARPGFEAAMPGIFRASTVYFPDMASVRSLDRSRFDSSWYGLFGTPTTQALQTRIARLEGGRHSLLLPSGMAAIALVDLALLQSGDEVLLPDNAYVTGWELAKHELTAFGIRARSYDPMRPETLTQALGARTRLVWLEAPGSLTLEFPDLPDLLARARAAPEAVVALDNTWGSGLAFDPFALTAAGLDRPGVDISVNALTKYASGGADVLMGAVTTRDDALHARLRAAHMRHGWGVGADDVALLLRSLPSLPLRYAAQDASARSLAAWCNGRPEFAAVLHPALPGSPGHAHWSRLCQAAAGVFTLVFAESLRLADVDRFVDALTRFRIGYSWGGSTSLAMVYDPRPWRTGQGLRHAGPLVRLSIGLEAVDELRADFEHALAEMAVGSQHRCVDPASK